MTLGYNLLYERTFLDPVMRTRELALRTSKLLEQEAAGADLPAVLARARTSAGFIAVEFFPARSSNPRTTQICDQRRWRVTRYFMDGPAALVPGSGGVSGSPDREEVRGGQPRGDSNLRGIDVAQFAPVDFSMDAGRPVQGDDLEVTAARNRVVRTSVKM